MTGKTEQLQIRLTPQQKNALKRAARVAGTDVSRYVLSRLLPTAEDRFGNLLRAIQPDGNPRYALAELNDFLHVTPPVAFADAVARGDVSGLTRYLQNYVAAMVELAAAAKDVTPPSWVRDVAPLESPVFATSLESVRLHLLRSAPVPFKRRNIFIDASIGDRV